MSRPRPVDWKAIRAGLLVWFADVSGVDTVWGQQSAPQPKYPYASISIIGPGPNNFGVHGGQHFTIDGDLNIVRQREFVLSCQIHVGADDAFEFDCDAWAIGDSVTAALNLPSSDQALAEIGVALRDRGEPQNIALVVGSEWIGRVQFDLRFGLTSVMTPDNTPQLRTVGYFDKVAVSSTIEGIKNPGGSLELDNEILDPNA